MDNLHVSVNSFELTGLPFIQCYDLEQYLKDFLENTGAIVDIDISIDDRDGLAWGMHIIVCDSENPYSRIERYFNVQEMELSVPIVGDYIFTLWNAFKALNHITEKQPNCNKNCDWCAYRVKEGCANE